MEQKPPELTDLIPVMRYHLNDTLITVDAALDVSAAEDVIAGKRQGLAQPITSSLTNSLSRVYDQLHKYLELEKQNDDETATTDESVPPTE